MAIRGKRTPREQGRGRGTHMSMTLVEISGQKLWTMELRLASAWSLSSGAGSCSIANNEPAELTAAAAMLSPTLLRLPLRSGSPPPQGDLACALRVFSVRRGALGAPQFLAWSRRRSWIRCGRGRSRE
jgi:hypothetical protein